MEEKKPVRPSGPVASDVAKYLLERKGTLTGYQLQKLLYYCQAWSLVVEGRPLFPEEVRAFRHGPTVTSVFMQHRGKRHVRSADISGSSAALSADDKALADAVLRAYDGLSGDQLESLSHEEEPWRECFNQCTSVSSSAVIARESMRSYYARLLVASEDERRHHHVPTFDHPKNIYVSESDYEWLLDYLGADG